MDGRKVSCKGGAVAFGSLGRMFDLALGEVEKVGLEVCRY